MFICETGYKTGLYWILSCPEILKLWKYDWQYTCYKLSLGKEQCKSLVCFILNDEYSLKYLGNKTQSMCDFHISRAYLHSYEHSTNDYHFNVETGDYLGRGLTSAVKL